MEPAHPPSISNPKRKFHPLWVMLLVFLLSSSLFVVEILLDRAFGIGEGIIYSWKIHSKIVLFHFGVNLLTMTYVLLASKRSWLKNIGLSILAVLFILLIIELIYFVLLCFRTDGDGTHLVKTYIRPPNEKAYSIFTNPDEHLGFKPFEGSFSASCVAVNGSDSARVYDVTYQFDEFGRRITPASNARNAADQYALFFGGSFTLGEGLQADETLPFAYQQLDTNVVAYNYGFSGYGTSQVLSRLRYYDVKAEVPQKNGFFIYSFIDDHIKRSYGFHNFQVSYGAKSPCYEWRDGNLEFQGTFMRANPVLHYLYFLLNNSNFLAYYYIDIPLSVGPKQYRYVAKMIEESYEEYKRQFGNDNFYLLIFPGNSAEITKYIKNPAVKILNYSTLYKNPVPFTIYPPYENHPNAAAYKKVAEKMYQDIR